MTPHREDSRTAKLLRIGFALFLFVLVLAMTRHTSDPTGHIKFLLIHWAAALFTLVWLLGSWLEMRPIRRPPLLFIPLAGFLCLNLIAAALSTYPEHSVTAVNKLLSLILLYLVAAHVYRQPRHLTPMLLSICGAVACASVYAVFQRLGLDPFPWADKSIEQYTHLPGTFGNPNVAGHTLILAIVTGLYLASRPRMRWVALPVALFLYHFYATHHRSGIAALAAAALVFASIKIVATRSFPPRIAVLATMLLCAAMSLLGFAGIAAYGAIAHGRAVPIDGSLLLRYNGYLSASEMIAQGPLLGYGPGNYVIENPRFWTPYEQEWFESEHMMNAHVHNELLEEAIGAGLPAALLFLAFLAIGFTAGCRMAFHPTQPTLRRLGLFFAAFFAALSIDGLFGFNLRAPVSAFLIFLMAGALEGLHMPLQSPSPARAPAMRGVLWRTGLLVVAAAVVFFETRVFLSEVHLQRGKALAYAEYYGHARAAFEKGEELAPWNWLFARQLGMAALLEEDYPEAVAQLRRSAELNPNWVATLLPLAQAGLRLGLSPDTGTPEARGEALELAIRYARRVTQLDPWSRSGAETLGRAAFARGQALTQSPGASEDAREAAWKEAGQALEKTLELGARPKGPLCVMLAKARLALGDPQRAEEALLDAVEAAPYEDGPWAALAAYASEFEKYDVMRKALQRKMAALESRGAAADPKRARLNLWFAKLREDGYRNVEGAERAYAEATRQAPHKAEIWRRFGDFAQRSGRLAFFKEIVLDTHSLLARSGKKLPPEIHTLALAWGGAGPAQAARDLLRIAQTPPPETPARTGGPELAWIADAILQELQQVPTGTPDSAETFLLLGQTYTHLKDPAMAASMFAAASPGLTGEARTRCTQLRVAALRETGQDREALLILESAVSREPGNLNLRLFLARELARSGAQAQAQEEFRRILRSPQLKQDDRLRVQSELEAITTKGTG